MKNLFIVILFLFSGAVSAKTIELTTKNSIVINTPIDDMSVAKAQVDVMTKCYAGGGDDLFLVLYTPGGSVSAGRQFISFVKALPCKVHTITMMAASMGYQIAQALETRYITSSGVLMSHRATLSGIGGQLDGELESRLNWIKSMVDQMELASSKRVGLSIKVYKELIKNELWLVGPNAVGQKHADEVVDVRCDKSITGTHAKVVNTFFGSYKVTYHDCPLIQSPLKVERAGRQELTEKDRVKFLNYINPFHFVKQYNGYQINN